MNVFARRLGLAAVSLSTLFALPAGAQGLPAAKELIARYAKEVGGDAWKSHTSARMKATMEFPGIGMKADIEAVNVFANRAYMMKMSIPGMGEAISGYDGTTAWMKEPTMGARILTGAEAEQIVEEADPEASLRTTANIVSSETVEKTSMNGKDCYKVKHTWKSGRTTHDCFGVSDGLLVATMSKQTSAMGEMDVTQFYSEYKDMAGMKRATVMSGQMMGQELKTTLTSWEWDTVKPADTDPPADIKALLTKKGQ
jgi:hypothetical protein